jgi:subtilisin family serine protease
MVMAGPSAAGGETGQGKLPGRPATGMAEEYVPGQVVVKYKSGVSAQSKARTTTRVGGAEVLNEFGPPGREKAQVVELKTDVSVEQAVAELKARGDVQYAEPNYIYHAAYRPNDPSYGEQWGFKNDGQNIKDTTGTAGADIKVESAWDIEQGSSNPVTVAIIDTGCDFTHPDLASKLLPNGYNFCGITQTSINWQAPAGNWENWYFAQSIKGTGGQLTHIGIAAQKVGNPTGNIYVGISTSLDPPDGVITYYTIAPSEVTTAGNEIYKALPSAVTLQDGVTYYIKIATDNIDPGIVNYYNLFYNYGTLPGGNGPVYADGVGWYYNTTQGWQQGLWDDFYFRTNPNDKPRDDGGHGTHCAGITAAVSNNGVGVAGTCPGANILPIKVLNTAGSGTLEDIASGVYYAADHGAGIISMSLQGSQRSDAMQEACTYAYNKGLTLFAAVGNNGTSSISYPAGYDHVIGVGATTNKDEKADFSQYNSSVDVSAPGKDVYSTLPTYPVTSTMGGEYQNNYDYLSGTSMACPMAAGVGALVKSHEPSLSNAEIERRLEGTADDLGTKGRDDKFGYGRVNAAAALSGGPKSSWYLAEGTTAWGFDTYISIENPNGCGVNADITYMTGSGAQSGPSVYLPALSQATVSPKDTLGSQDFSTQVTCREGLGIAVDRTMTWTGPGAPSEEAHSSVGVTAPQTTWYLPEGSANWGFECWLLIQNPNASEATCNVTYMIEGAGPQTVTKKVPANSRKSFNMADDIGSKDASIKVESATPVIPERAMYRNNRREGHDSIGTTYTASDYYLAEGTTAWGFTTYVLIQNPNNCTANVTVTYMTTAGAKPQPAFQMSANSRKTIKVNDALPNADFSTLVHADQAIIAERAMYWDKGTGESCHDSIGMPSAHTTFYLPDGQASNGRETWTLVQNPNSCDVTVEISYLTPNGQGDVVFQDTVPANSRKTYNMADRGIGGRAAVMVTSKTSGQKIMVERAMYWNNRGAGTDTIGGYSD